MLLLRQFEVLDSVPKIRCTAHGLMCGKHLLDRAVADRVNDRLPSFPIAVGDERPQVVIRMVEPSTGSADERFADGRIGGADRTVGKQLDPPVAKPLIPGPGPDPLRGQSLCRGTFRAEVHADQPPLAEPAVHIDIPRRCHGMNRGDPQREGKLRCRLERPILLVGVHSGRHRPSELEHRLFSHNARLSAFRRRLDSGRQPHHSQGV